MEKTQKSSKRFGNKISEDMLVNMLTYAMLATYCYPMAHGSLENLDTSERTCNTEETRPPRRRPVTPNLVVWLPITVLMDEDGVGGQRKLNSHHYE